MQLKERETEIPSSSMADIAFLLLVFFLLTTTINLEKAIVMNLPDPEPIPIPPENIETIIINEKDRLSYDNEAIQLTEIYQRVKDRTAMNKNLIIEVRSSRKASYQRYISVLDQIKRAEAKKISVQIDK